MVRYEAMLWECPVREICGKNRLGEVLHAHRAGFYFTVRAMTSMTYGLVKTSELLIWDTRSIAIRMVVAHALVL